MQSFRDSAGDGAGHGRIKTLAFAWILCLLTGNCLSWRAAAADSPAGIGGQASTSAASEKSVTAELRNLRQAGAYNESCMRAEEYLSKNAGSAMLRLEYGRSLMEVGEYGRAEKVLQESISSAPIASNIRLNAIRALGELLEESGRQIEAQSLWDQLLGRYRAGGLKGSESLGAAAVAAWHRGYFRDAQDIFIDATDPQLGEVSPDVLADFGFLLLEKYNAKEALGAFRDCLKVDKLSARARLGIALAKKYDSDFEVELYSKAALEINPNLAGAWNALAQLSIEAEDYPEALTRIDAVLSVNPRNLQALSLQAFCHYAQGDAAGFEKIERRVLELNPSCGEFYYTLADNLVSRRKYKEAVDWSRKAIALQPELWTAHLLLGMNLTRIGSFEEGRKSIQRAFDGDPYNVWAINSLDLFDQVATFNQVQSEHFLFRMAKEDTAALGSYAPALAEEAYANLTRRYGFKPDGPLQMEIYPDQGGFAVRTLGLPGLSGILGVCFGKVVAIDSPSARPKGTFNWGSTLWHEFVHVITLQMTGHNIPRWYSEGLSVYEEHRARPGWGDNLSPAFLHAYKAGKLMKASELNAGFVRPSSPEQVMLAYFQAGLVCEMIEQKYGFEKIRQSLLLFAKNMPAEEVFLQTLGLNAAQMDEAYAKYIDSRFREIASHVRFPDEGAAQETEAKAALQKKLETDPEDFWANLRLGQLLRKERANAEAEIYLMKAKKYFPQYADEGNPYQLLGEMYIELKRDDEALAQLRSWTKFDGTARGPLLTAAEIYLNRKDWVSAVEMLGLAVFIDPYDSAVLRKLGDAAMACGKWAIAIDAYRSRAGSSPADPAGAHLDLARALAKAGNRQEAKREVLKSLESAPSYREAQELLLTLAGETP
jgi:cellulose synthase operon protein C